MKSATPFPYSVLIVDDERPAVKMLARLVRRDFQQVHTAFNGKEGLERFREHAPDIVVTDLRMPVMDGLEMIRQIREGSPETTIIVLSAFNDQQYLFRAIELRVDKYLVKPIRSLQLKEVLGELASKRLEAQLLREELDKSEARYREVVETTRDLIMRTDKDARHLYVNGRSREIYGLEPEECIGLSAFDFIHPEERAEVKREFERIFARKQKFVTKENRLVGRDGKVTWILWQFSIHYDERGEPSHVDGIGSDITAQRLREEELRYHMALEKLVADLAVRFMNHQEEEADLPIENALEEVGRFIKADRSYLFLYDAEGNRLSNSHEWLREGIPPEKGSFREIPLASFPWWSSVMKKGEDVRFCCLEEFPKEAESERDLLERKEIRSVVAVPLEMAGRSIGVLGFGTVLEERRWGEETVSLLRSLGGAVASLLEREKNRKALSNANRLLVQAQEMARMGNWEMDHRTGALTWSESLYRMFGFPPEKCAITFPEFLDLLLEEDRKRLETIYKKSLEKREGYEIIYRYRLSDGRIRYNLGRGIHEFDEEGKPVRTFGFSQDITEQVEREKELARQVEINQLLARSAQALLEGTVGIETMSAMILECARSITDSAGGCITGVDEGGSLGRLLAGNSSEEAEEQRCRLYESTAFHLLERNEAAFDNEGGEGITRWIFAPALLQERLVGRLLLVDGKRPYDRRDLNAMEQLAAIYAVAVQKLRYEEALHHSEARYRALAENTRAVAWQVDLEKDEMVYIAPHVEELLGYPQESWKTCEDWLSRVADEDRTRFLAGRPKEGEPWKNHTMEFRMVRTDGERIWLRNVVSVLFREEKAVGLVGLMIDINDLKSKEEGLREATRKLKELNSGLEAKVKQQVEANREKDQLMFQQARFAQMGEMLSMIAHQWRQPLNAISAAAINTRLRIDLGTYSEEKAVEKAKFIEEQTRKMSETINDFMNFFRPGKEKNDFLVREVLDDALRIIGAQMENREIRVEVSAEENLVIYGIRNELEHVVLNLAANARDVLDAKERGSDRWIRIRAFREGAEVKITVEDNGGGISPEIMGEIFDPYFTTKGPTSGTGIGLYMSRTIIQRNYQGSLEASNGEEGAVFTITLKGNR